MAYKAGGAPCSLYREHIALNQGTYTAATQSDDYRWSSSISGTPAAPAHVVSNPPYSTQPISDNWAEHVAGKVGASAGDAANYQK